MTSVLQYDAFIPPQRGFNYMSNERLVAAANQFKRLLLDNKLLVVAVVCTTVYLGILDKVLESEAMKLDDLQGTFVNVRVDIARAWYLRGQVIS